MYILRLASTAADGRPRNNDARCKMNDTSQMMNDTNNDEPDFSREIHASPAPEPDFSASVQPSYVRTVFLGPDGLRAGWGLAFYIAMFYPLQFLATRWASSLELGASGLWTMMLVEFGVLVAAIVPALVLARVENRTWGVYGL